jgi:hypothetical protein
MHDPYRAGDPLKLFPDTAPPDREVDLTHAAGVSTPAPAEGDLHLGAGDVTACGKPRAGLAVTDRRVLFMQAKAGNLASYPKVCDACHHATEGTEGAYRSKG